MKNKATSWSITEKMIAGLLLAFFTIISNAQDSKAIDQLTKKNENLQEKHTDLQKKQGDLQDQQSQGEQLSELQRKEKEQARKQAIQDKAQAEIDKSENAIQKLKDTIAKMRKSRRFTRRYNRIKHRSVSPYSLDSTKTIVYDFKAKEYLRSNVKAHINEPLVFKIININRLAYDIKFKSENIAINDEFLYGAATKSVAPEPVVSKPAEETKDKNITAPTLSPESQRLKPGDKESVEAKQLSDKAKIEIQPLREKSLKNSDTISRLESAIKIADSIPDTRPTDSLIIKKVKLQTLYKENEIIASRVNAITDKLVEELKEKNVVYKAAEVTFNRLYNHYQSMLEKSQQLTKIENHYEDYRCLVLNPLLDKKYYLKLRTQKFFIFEFTSTYKKQIEEFENEYSQFNIIYNGAISDWKLMDELDKDVRENLRNKYQMIKEEIDKMKAKADAADLISKLRKVYAIDRILYNDEGYTVASAPIQPLEDYVTFNITINNRDQKKQAEYDDGMEINHIEYTKGGVRFDFSTGIAFDFPLDKQDRDDDDYYDSYEVREVKVLIDGVDTPIAKKIYGTSRNTFKPSLAALFHTSFRTANYVSLGLTLGASLNVEKLDLNSLYVGPSLLLGKKQKFIFTAGPAFKQLDVLKKNYSINSIYNLDDFNESTTLTAKQFRIGLFFAITYNLTQNQKSNFKLTK